MEDGFEVVNLHGCASGVIPTPTIGTNGNWFVGNKDTDVAAKGADGAVGEQGPQGLKGDQGEIGPAGPQGIQGIQGEKGEKGDQGIQGETGDQGEKGDQGIQGIQGEKGDQGIQGIQGEKGEKGEKGTDVDPAVLKKLSGEVDAVKKSLTNVSTELVSTKKSVADGKALVASAITNKGVTTAADATFQTMATNVRSIVIGKTVSSYGESMQLQCGYGGSTYFIIPLQKLYRTLNLSMTNSTSYVKNMSVIGIEVSGAQHTLAAVGSGNINISNVDISNYRSLKVAVSDSTTGIQIIPISYTLNV